MRTVLLVAVAALVLVPAASAATKPKQPTGFHFVFPHRIVLAPVQRRDRQPSCAAESRRSSSNKRVSKPRPVACEQPPRVNLNGASGSMIASFHL